MTKKGVRFYFKKIIIVIFGILASVIILELLLTVVDRTNYDRFINDRISGLLTYRPNVTFTESSTCYENSVEINNIGFHGKKVETNKKNGVYRVVIIGGSFPEALQVQIDDMVSSILENELNLKGIRYEVIPIAFSGNKTMLNMLYYDRFAKNLSPDLVINLVTEYESLGVSSINKDSSGKILLEVPSVSENKKVVEIKNLMRKSKLVMNVYFRLTTLKNVKQRIIDSLLWKKQEDTVPIDHATEKQWGDESELLSLFNQEVKKSGAKFVLVSWSTPHVSSTAKDDLRKNLMNISRKNKIPYLDLEPEMTKAKNNQNIDIVWVCNDHWNVNGHRIAGEIIGRYLKSNPYLISK